VYHSHKKASMADDPRSAMSESIRTLRANLDYHFDGMRNKVILLTSSNSGEGKSFTSFNIAVSLAMLERKVILVDFDLRKPHLHNLLKSENKIGVSAVLEGSLSLEAAITQTPHQHMDFIAAGHLRPNPNELISSERTSDFIAALKKKYDYVILDTPPVGLVSEAFLLMRHADLKIIVARQAVTSKKALSVLMRELEVKQIKNIVWLLNDVSVQNTMYAKNNEYFNV
jgi:tyrosine-protein kinase Etk/Wzc